MYIDTTRIEASEVRLTSLRPSALLAPVGDEFHDGEALGRQRLRSKVITAGRMVLEERGNHEIERDSSQKQLFADKAMHLRATLTRTPPASLGHSDVPQPDTEVR